MCHIWKNANKQRILSWDVCQDNWSVNRHEMNFLLLILITNEKVDSDHFNDGDEIIGEITDKKSGDGI